MACEKFWKPIDHFGATTRTALARNLARAIDGLVETIVGGNPIVVPSEWLSFRYTKACLMLEHLLDHPELEEASRLWRRPVDSLVVLNDESDMEWEYGGRQTLRQFRGFLDELYVRMSAEPVHDSAVETLLAEMEAGRLVYGKEKKQHEAIWVENVEKAAAEWRAAASRNVQHKPSTATKQPIGFRPPKPTQN